MIFLNDSGPRLGMQCGPGLDAYVDNSDHYYLGHCRSAQAARVNTYILHFRKFSWQYSDSYIVSNIYCIYWGQSKLT